LDTIRWLWEFQAWARPRLLGALENVPEERLRAAGLIAGGQYGGSVLGTLVHLVDVEATWLARWTGSTEAPEPDPAHLAHLGGVSRHWKRVEDERAEFLATLTEMDVDRPAVAGAKVTLGQALLHVSNHTSHHRAEICVGLTALGSPPPGFDVMDFVRGGT